MTVSVLAGFAVARVATVVTCLLVGRAIRDRRMGSALRAARAARKAGRRLRLRARPAIFPDHAARRRGPCFVVLTRDSVLAGD